MKKEVFVTAGLCRIKDQIAEAARDPIEQNPEKPSGKNDPAAPVSIFSSLPEETRKALLARQREYEHFRKDLLFRLHEFSAEMTRMEKENRQNAETLQSVQSGLESLLHRLDQQQEPDEFSPDFQTRLADNFRELDRMRLDLIQLQAIAPQEKTQANNQQINLFAEMDSISFGQLFRIGSALMMPLILAILFSSILLMLTIVLTFRVGL